MLLFSGILLASCVKEEIPQPSDSEEQPTAAVTRSAGEKDPYKLSLVQEALDAKLAQMGLPRIVLKPTHYYVCFSPTDSAQVAKLETLDIITSYNPIGEEGLPIPEADENSQDEILPLYSVVPVNFPFPADIPYTKIYDVYIQSLGGAGSASGSDEQLPTDMFKDVLMQTLTATGKAPVATRADKPREWNPSARFRFHVTVRDGLHNPRIDDSIPLKQLNVVVTQGANQERCYSDADGVITATNKFIGPVDYLVVWDSHHFVIRQGNTWTRRASFFNGHKDATPLDTVITERHGLDYFIAGSHRALTAYYTEPNLVPGLVRRQKFLNAGIMDSEDVNVGIGDWTIFNYSGRFIPGLRHPISLYAKASGTTYKPSGTAMEMTFHELGHASHHAKNAVSYNSMFVSRRKDMESWANGVSYSYMSALLGEGYEWNGTTTNKYTRLVESLLLNGFTMEQIQFEFYGSDDWGHWQSRIRNRGDKQISDQLVNLIFDNPNDYALDMRDMIQISDTLLRRYQPTLLRLMDHVMQFTVNDWEIVDGTSSQIINSNDARLEVCFTEPGEKTIRATVQIAPGVEETFEKTVSVASASIISAPATAKEGYPVTVSMMDMEDYPNARVREWSVAQGDVAITSKTDRSAQYTFRQPGDMTIKLKIQFYIGGPIMEYSHPIKVKALDDYSVFAVINKPAYYSYNTTYQAKYMGQATDVNVTKIEIDNLTYLPYYYFDTWSYNKVNKVINFSVPAYNVPFDYQLTIFYTVNGIEVKEPAKLIISNFREGPPSGI